VNTHLKQLWAAMKLPEKLQKKLYFFCRGLDIRVSQVMKSQVFQPCVLQNLLVDVDHRVRVVHLACLRGWEHPWIAWVFLVFCDQQIDGILWNRDFAN
jgi:hypothetical protein